MRFPDGFWWGAATSGPQSEGRFNKRHANVFDHWYEVAPDDFHDHVGPDTASNFYNSFREDIALMAEVGLNSVRTSIQWTRLIKDFETCEVDSEGAAFYNAVIDRMIECGIEPVMNLHHFDMPYELLERYGGWESKHVVDLYAGYAEQAFRLFGDRVHHWFTFNEPMVIVEGGYLYQFHYPKIVDGRRAVQVAYNLALASAKAIERFRALGMGERGAKIGAILNLTPPIPATGDAADVEAAHIADLWCNRLFLDAAVKGEFPRELVDLLERDGVLWDAAPEELLAVRANTIDELGVNFYHPIRVKRPDVSPQSLTLDWMPGNYYADYTLPGARMNVDRGWEIYPRSLYDIAKDVQDNYGNIPWFVSENGMGVSREERYLDADGVIQDDYRIRFITEHLSWLNKAIEEGSNCFGYHEWTPIDCWSWANAYKNRYGFISNDIHTQMKTIKKSGRWFRRVAESNGAIVEPILIG